MNKFTASCIRIQETNHDTCSFKKDDVYIPLCRVVHQTAPALKAPQNSSINREKKNTHNRRNPSYSIPKYEMGIVSPKRGWKKVFESTNQDLLVKR